MTTLLKKHAPLYINQDEIQKGWYNTLFLTRSKTTCIAKRIIFYTKVWEFLERQNRLKGKIYW